MISYIVNSTINNLAREKYEQENLIENTYLFFIEQEQCLQNINNILYEKKIIQLNETGILTESGSGFIEKIKSICNSVIKFITEAFNKFIAWIKDKFSKIFGNKEKSEKAKKGAQKYQEAVNNNEDTIKTNNKDNSNSKVDSNISSATKINTQNVKASEKKKEEPKEEEKSEAPKEEKKESQVKKWDNEVSIEIKREEGFDYQGRLNIPNYLSDMGFKNIIEGKEITEDQIQLSKINFIDSFFDKGVLSDIGMKIDAKNFDFKQAGEIFKQYTKGKKLNNWYAEYAKYFESGDISKFENDLRTKERKLKKDKDELINTNNTLIQTIEGNKMKWDSATTDEEKKRNNPNDLISWINEINRISVLAYSTNLEANKIYLQNMQNAYFYFVSIGGAAA